MRGPYDAIAGGLSLSGESREFFRSARVRELRAQLPSGFEPRRVLDFGCGIGDTAAHLAQVFPYALVVAVDTEPNAIEHARRLHGGTRVWFALARDLASEAHYDLCYADRPLRPVVPAERVRAVRSLHGLLAQGGWLALVEDVRGGAQPREAERLLREGGFAAVSRPRYPFGLPRALGWLRFAEPALARLPLAAQYSIVAQKR